MTIKPGDVVQLTAPGSPPMTVERFQDGPLAYGTPGWGCVWFVQGALRRDVFPVEALQPYAPVARESRTHGKAPLAGRVGAAEPENPPTPSAGPA